MGSEMCIRDSSFVLLYSVERSWRHPKASGLRTKKLTIPLTQMKSNRSTSIFKSFVLLFFGAFQINIVLFGGHAIAQQNVLEGIDVKSSEIPGYSAAKVPVGKIKIDGKLDESAWLESVKSSEFVDLVSGKATIHSTRSAILWDDTNLYIAFWVQDPDVRAKYKKRDSPIYYDNDIEIFIAAENAYYEFEMNAFGTIYEAFVMWDDRYDELKFAAEPTLAKTHQRSQPFNGVGYTTHPRGKRTIALDYDFPKLKSGVFVDGTINDSKDRDRGWTAEIALPWESMKKHLLKGDSRSCPPKANDVWRINLFRFNQYKEAAPAKDSGGWAWSKHSVWDSHVPECFPKIKFGAAKKEKQP